MASLAVAVAGAGAKSEDRLSESPPGQVMVIDANLMEVNRAPDVADPKDMENFVSILLTRLTYAPDALALQEVRRESAENVARFLSEQTGYRYGAVVADDQAFLGDGVKRETAIVLNLDTMRALDDGGFLRDEVRARNGKVKDYAYLLAKERRGGLSMALVSVHLAGANPDKERSTQQIAEFVDERYSSPSRRQVEVIAGDFNSRRCVAKEPTPDCEPRPSYDVITNGFGYQDAFLAGNPDDAGRTKYIDYIFARAGVIDADADLERKARVGSDAEFKECKQLYTQGRSSEAEGGCRTGFYSDHNFQWALLEMENGGARPETGAAPREAEVTR
jgi:endonuclease/exonuclease/phosphatase family metal-dependent hydrolase